MHQLQTPVTKKVYAQMESLQAKDIAETIHFACSQPERVNISELVVLATDQKSIL